MVEMMGIEPEKLLPAVHGALSNWGHFGGSDSELLGYLLLVRERRAMEGNDQTPLGLRRATNAVLEEALGELAVQDPVGAKILRARFVDGEIARKVATRVHASPDQVNRWQRSAIHNLTQIIFAHEMALRKSRMDRLLAALPPATYTRLFGMIQPGREIRSQLLREGEPWVVAIAGIGGIGKTSLADAIVRQVIDALVYSEVVWLRAGTRHLSGAKLTPAETFEHLIADMAEKLATAGLGESPAERLERIRRLLKSEPHLVIIDNLESEEHTTYLLTQVRQFVNPSKFLLTTRARPTVSAPAFFRSLDELPFEDAAALLQHHAQQIGLLELTGIGQDDIHSIYDLTGGNPLALKLVAGLAMVMPLSQILNDLARSRPGPIEDLYRHIYMEAWRKLTPEAQSLLQAMPLISESGALPDQMQAICGLAEGDFWSAVTDLFSRSLLEARGTIQERRYGIHRLTETFLRTEIIHWPEA